MSLNELVVAYAETLSHIRVYKMVIVAAAYNCQLDSNNVRGLAQDSTWANSVQPSKSISYVSQTRLARAMVFTLGSQYYLFSVTD